MGHIARILRQLKQGAAVQQDNPNITLITPTAAMAAETHGRRAKCLQRLVRLDLPVPLTIALSFEAVHGIAAGDMPDLAALIAPFSAEALLCVRPSSEDPDWGGPGAVLNIGMNDAKYVELSDRLGKEAASELYLRFVQSYSTHVARLDPDIFDDVASDPVVGLGQALRAYENETEEDFPKETTVQLAEVLRSMARAWEGTTARLLRQAKGAPADAGLGLVVQEMAFGLGQGECGSGVMQLVDSTTGARQITGRYMSQSQGRDALRAGSDAMYLMRDPRGPSLEELAPKAFARLREYTELMRVKLREEMQVEFTIENGEVYVLDGVRVARNARAAVAIAVVLAEDGIISREEALMRIEPRALNELLHRQVDPEAPRDVLARGVAASPGAATGKIVFTAEAAQAHAARDEPCVLVRRETSPEDIRGMHAAVAVLTERGGMTSHAAVIGRGIGLPCAVGASDIVFDVVRKQLTMPDGRALKKGDVITIDGSNGEVLAGETPLLEAARDESFQTLMAWADEVRDIAVRANADTPADAEVARNFRAQGIGLCRTEHMFFEADRLDLPLSDVTRRVEALGEYNPMLGMRGVRLGITVPEIYEMQARAIFEATIRASTKAAAVVPEIMIPLVSARREVELVKGRVDAIAAAVRAETGKDFAYRLGVMVETPRAALRAGEIAEHSAFLSFGTNDLTQMTYGLSRDDAGRFMSAYVQQGVFEEDPFQQLDLDGVGELLLLGAARGRSARPDVMLSMCGEHAGHPDSLGFCRRAGFDYVSCSPFRVPVAKLAAAQLSIADRDLDGDIHPDLDADA